MLNSSSFFPLQSAPVGLPAGLAKLFVIHAARFVERRKRIESQLAVVGMPFEFVMDFDIPEITEDITRRFFAAGGLSKSQQSCALKHWRAMQHIVDAGYAHTLVLEDDVIFAPGFSLALHSLMIELAATENRASVTFLGCGGHYYIPADEIRVGQLLYQRNQGKFADSYIVSFDAAKRRLDWIAVHGITHPIDHLFELIDRETGTSMLWLEPPVVEQGSHNGTFASALDKSHPLWFQFLQFRWKKMWRRRQHLKDQS